MLVKSKRIGETDALAGNVGRDVDVGDQVTQFDGLTLKPPAIHLPILT